VTDRGKEARERVRKCRPEPRRRPRSRQDLSGYEQKLHTRPMTPDERAADREVEPEEGAQVNGELGQGQITTLIWGDLRRVPASRACPKGGADAATHSVL